MRGLRVCGIEFWCAQQTGGVETIPRGIVAGEAVWRDIRLFARETVQRAKGIASGQDDGEKKLLALLDGKGGRLAGPEQQLARLTARNGCTAAAKLWIGEGVCTAMRQLIAIGNASTVKR